ncbi:myoD family inhibitor domain-containing protein 2 isoform X2 [Zonotrichia leucophrys gambelii]|uniref:myoD family inhibitor domain-containing protein 2 isoform X2 n=1 Tax=Zonotrichia leucophrys gambelii TaxID=257770 RepID=UPI00314078D9
MSEDKTDKVKIKAAESFEHEKQNISWLKKDRRTSSLPLLALPGVTSSSEDHPDNQLTNEKHTDEKPMKGIVMSSVAEFSITDASSKGTKNEKKLSDASRSSIASLEKCREFSYIEDDASVHQRDSDDITRPPTKTTAATTATVTVTLIAASLSPAMRPASAWSWPWRSLKSAIADRKIIDKIHQNYPTDYKGDFFF